MLLRAKEGRVILFAKSGRRRDGDQLPWSQGLSCPMVKRACALCAGAAGRPGPRYRISDGAPRLVAPTRGPAGEGGLADEGILNRNVVEFFY